MSTFANLSKSKKSNLTTQKELNLTKFKKPDLTKAKKSDFANTNSLGIDFLFLKVKKTLIYLQKAFTKIPILYYFDPKYYIPIKINISGYSISEVLNK